ncbi:hypothetical protein G7Y41_04910 [Schaalia sp. ZJ405]|uniref:tetratricopeptide repeat protein n=1 Tax=Schaalia sp. ZJ405 TaxID=2709403 RepID=UPI0018C96A2B|nr:tetratricopeptide repeat protein [Schaalia sp. ZJ405]QPK80464.1 hypothetical protein G7Y41_04910 [Schaalia sp. ZJ405]
MISPPPPDQNDSLNTAGLNRDGRPVGLPATESTFGMPTSGEQFTAPNPEPFVPVSPARPAKQRRSLRSRWGAAQVIALTVLVLGIVVSLGFPLAARASVDSLYLNGQDPNATGESPDVYALAPAGSGTDYDVDTFPIFDHDSPSATKFPFELSKEEGVTIEQWRSYFEAVSEPLGVDGLADTIIGWYQHLAPPEKFSSGSYEDFDLRAYEGEGFRGFRDDEVDSQIASIWPHMDQLTKKEQKNLNNLAAGLFLQSVGSPPLGEPGSNIIAGNPNSYLVSAAYSLWTQLLDTSVSCEASSNLFALTKIAASDWATQNEQWEQEKESFRERVAASCADTRSIDYFEATVNYKIMVSKEPDNLVAPWEEFVDRHPDSATGYAALAWAQITQAYLFSFGFNKTRLYEQALSNANKARSLASIPEAGLTATRALILLQQEEAAKDAAAQISHEIKPESPLWGSLAGVHAALGDYDQAASIIAQPHESSQRLAVTIPEQSYKDFKGYAYFGIPYTANAMAQILQRPRSGDVGAGGMGGGTVSFNSLFPDDTDYIASRVITEDFALGKASKLKIQILQGDNTDVPHTDDEGFNAVALLKEYGQFERARALVKQELNDLNARGSDDYDTYTRLLDDTADLAYLQGDFATSASALEELVDVYDRVSGMVFDGRIKVCLSQARFGIALDAAGSAREALKVLDSALERCNDPEASSHLSPSHKVEIPALIWQRKGEIYLDLEDLNQAASSFTEVLSAIDAHLLDLNSFNGRLSAELSALRAAASNNLAAIMLKQGTDPAQALVYAQAAHEADPTSPVYQENYAWALQENGKTEEALPEYEEVTKKDATTFAALNNTALLRYENGEKDEALTLLRQAVTANHDYALGWANLSVMLAEREGFKAALQSQGAWAKAVSLDPSLRGTTEGLRPDREVYDTGLDVSKAVPTTWAFAAHSKPRSPAPGIAAMILSVLTGLGVALRNSRLAPWIASFLVGNRVSTWLRQRMTSRSSAGWHVLFSPVFAVAVTSLLVVHFSWGGGPANFTILFLAIGLVAFLAFVPVLARQLVSPGRGLRTAVTAPESFVVAPTTPPAATTVVRGRHFTWWPFTLVAAILAPTGMVMTPLPMLNDPEGRHPRLRTIGFVAVYAVAVVLVVCAVLTNVPVARTLSVAALLMISSMLLTIKPIDGAFLTPKALCIVLSVIDFVVGLGVVLNYL